MTTSEESGTVKLVDRILSRAAKEGASDIHIEPRIDEVRVRFRIDGLLVERPAFAAGYRYKVANRLKIMANLDIAERRLPQDGAFRLRIEQMELDVRLSSFPTEYGEKVVLRLLPQSQMRHGLDGLGIPKDMAARIRHYSSRAHGMVLVTGPTGSGKTSTLYGILHEADGKSRNICTLEDPIEYRFEDVIQAQTNPRIGFTFARGLRSVLRQDPDVIMVGEMRDAETADIAFKAALTGHLVLSTLHTSSAIETFVRLFDMGLERYVVASALNGMLAQRLVRRVCLQCRQPIASSTDTDALFKKHDVFIDHLYQALGCDRCHGTGYVGRTGIFELIEADDELKDLVKSEETTRVELAHFLEGRGHHGLRRQGLIHASQGVTTIDEVLRVT